jgi:hypothetical protein
MWDILGNTFPINSNNKNMQALPGENQVVWKYQEKAQKVGQDKAIPEAYSNWGV